MPYTELSVTTNFAFLTGASHPEEMVERAVVPSLDITDRKTLAGVVRARQFATRTRSDLTRDRGYLPEGGGVRRGPSRGPVVKPENERIHQFG